MSAKRKVIQVRSTDERRERVDLIIEHLRGLGVTAKQSDAIDFALTMAEREIIRQQEQATGDH